MKIAVLADIHGRSDSLARHGSAISQADVVLIAGDITHFGGAGAAQDVIGAIRGYSRNVFAVSGNCDLPGVDDYLTGEGINLGCNVVDFGETVFAGIGGCMSGRNLFLHKPEEAKFQKSLLILEERLCGRRFVFVSHQPAWGSMVDAVGPDRHAGSRVIRGFIERTSPVLAISGHIHESPGTDKIGTTTIVNPGPFRNGFYAWVEMHDTVETVQMRG